MKRFTLIVGFVGLVAPGCSAWQSHKEIRAMQSKGELPSSPTGAIKDAWTGLQDEQQAMDRKVSIPGPSSIDGHMRETGSSVGR